MRLSGSAFLGLARLGYGTFPGNHFKGTTDVKDVLEVSFPYMDFCLNETVLLKKKNENFSSS